MSVSWASQIYLSRNHGIWGFGKNKVLKILRTSGMLLSNHGDDGAQFI